MNKPTPKELPAFVNTGQTLCAESEKFLQDLQRSDRIYSLIYTRRILKYNDAMLRADAFE